jgi:hypothetical protein
VLTRLRHDRIVGSHDEYCQADAGGTSEHTLDELFVTWYLHDAQAELTQVEGGEADVNGDAGAFLFRKSVAVDACQRFDQGPFCRGRCGQPPPPAAWPSLRRVPAAPWRL